MVHRRVVEPGRHLEPLLRGGHHGGAREGAGVHARERLRAVGVVGVVEGHPVLRQVREGALGEVAVGLLLVVDDVGGVVGDDVEEDLHALGVGLVDEGLEVLVGAEVRVDLGEVGDPVSVVAGRRVLAAALHGLVLEDRRQPDGGGAEPLDVVELLGEALEVAALVEALVGGVVAVGEARTGQSAAVVPGVPVGETVRQDEVELLPRQVVARRGGGELRVRGGAGGVAARAATGCTSAAASAATVTAATRRPRAVRRPGGGPSGYQGVNSLRLRLIGSDPTPRRSLSRPHHRSVGVTVPSLKGLQQ